MSQIICHVGSLSWLKRLGCWHARVKNGIVLRLCSTTITFDHGTKSQLLLEMLTDGGWVVLGIQTYKSPDDVVPENRNETECRYNKMLKDLMLYADWIFSHYITNKRGLDAKDIDTQEKRQI